MAGSAQPTGHELRTVAVWALGWLVLAYAAAGVLAVVVTVLVWLGCLALAAVVLARRDGRS